MACLRDGMESGALRRDLDADTLLPIFTGTIHSLIASHNRRQNAASGVATPDTKRIVDALFTLLAPPHGPSKPA